MNEIEPKGRLGITEDDMKAAVVSLILDSRPEEAIALLSKWYRVPQPKLGVGVFEGRTKGVAAVYSQNTKKILAAKREYMFDPFVMVHEFYHHLRSVGGKHRGTEKQADKFALEFIASYRRLASSGGHMADQTASSSSRTV